MDPPSNTSISLILHSIPADAFTSPEGSRYVISELSGISPRIPENNTDPLLIIASSSISHF